MSGVAVPAPIVRRRRVFDAPLPAVASTRITKKCVTAVASVPDTGNAVDDEFVTLMAAVCGAPTAPIPAMLEPQYSPVRLARFVVAVTIVHVAVPAVTCEK